MDCPTSIDLACLVPEMDKRLRATAYSHQLYSVLMTVPGVSPITPLSLISAFGDPFMFDRNSDLELCLGLMPSVHQSGVPCRPSRISRVKHHADTDTPGHISACFAVQDQAAERLADLWLGTHAKSRTVEGSGCHSPKDGSDHAGHVESRNRVRSQTYVVGTLHSEGAGLDPGAFSGAQDPGERKWARPAKSLCADTALCYQRGAVLKLLPRETVN